MIVSHIDPESRSTIASAEGFHALGRGDTVLAREKFAEAGKVLEDGAAHTESTPEKNLLRFLAATQYYHGGDYQRAKRIVQRTRPKYLSESDREKFEAFRKDVEERADTGYAKRLSAAVRAAWKERRFDDAIQLLQRHPYVLARAAIAGIRFHLCLRSGRIKAAVLFSADAIRFSNFDPDLVFARAGAATFLKALGKPAEAAEFLSLVQTKEPTALDWVAVCADLYSKLERGKGDSNAGWELLRLIDIARQGFAKLPPHTVADADVRDAMAHGYLLAAITADLLKGRQEAMQYVEAGETLATPGIFTDTFRQLRAARDGVWMHSPKITAQLDTISEREIPRLHQVEESALSKGPPAA